jgi:hypothetical protein
MKVMQDFEEAVKYVNAAKTKEQRNARKVLMHPILYGNPQKLGSILKNYVKGAK